MRIFITGFCSITWKVARYKSSCGLIMLTADHREDVERVCETLARSLETLHRNGLTHNSIQAENVFVEMKDGRPQRGLLLDLGRAEIGDCDWMRRMKRDEKELHQILNELREKEITARENRGPLDVAGATKDNSGQVYEG